MADRKLTPKQQRFVEEYLIDLNATQAAIRAGYSKKTAQEIGSENLAKPMIAMAIAQYQKKISEKLQIDAEWVLRQAVKVHQRCLQETPVLDSEGNPTGEYKFDSTGANKALDLIGKHINIQAFSDKMKVDQELTINVNSGIDLPPGKLDEDQDRIDRLHS